MFEVTRGLVLQPHHVIFVVILVWLAVTNQFIEHIFIALRVEYM
jgi:hypothetical protein